MSPPDIPPSGATPGPEGSPLPGRKLDSWGEIASYLGREVRTVQRWERTEGLPVHRHEHKKKSTVYAYAGELDAWIKRRQPKDDPEADAAFVPEQELSGTDSPVEIVDPPVAPPAPTPHAVSVPPSAGKRVVIALFALGILSALSLGVYRLLHPIDQVPEKVRLAVLPFTYLSGDSKPDFITAGLTDVIRTKLGQADPSHVGVISANSLLKIEPRQTLKDMGHALNVKYVLEGSVQRAGEHVIIDVQLIQVSDETHLWAESFPRDLSDVLQAESDVSATIAKEVLAALFVPPVPPPQPLPRSSTVRATTTRDEYFQGRFFFAYRNDLPDSIKFFKQAIHDDPSYAEAFSGLAAATAILGQVPNDGIPPREAKPQAREAAKRALDLNPRLSEAHAVLGNVAMSYDWDLDTAEKELSRAIELSPNDPTAHEWYCHLLIVEGRNSAALDEANQALGLEPRSPLFHTVLAETYYYGRAFDDAIKQAQQALALDPDFVLAQFWLGSAYREKKMYPQAIETFQNARRKSGDNPAMLMAYGHTQALAGNVQEARVALQKLRQLAGARFVPSLYPAAIHVGLGETDEAFRLLDIAYQERIDRLVWLNVEPLADPLRSDARFAQLMARIRVH
jgi:TolB-like protein/tetratricopeptide (TPR) repeat protein